jgi:hypothetical protein
MVFTKLREKIAEEYAANFNIGKTTWIGTPYHTIVVWRKHDALDR